MDSIVLDASMALAWGNPDEHSPVAERLLTSLRDSGLIVPSLWFVEVANALLVSARRKRVTQAEIARFFELIEGLAVETDAHTASRAFRYTLPLARDYGLTVYDATYLELAMREGLTLATLDAKLKKAAEQAGVAVFA